MRKYRILNLYYLTKLIKIIFFKSLYFINILNFKLINLNSIFKLFLTITINIYFKKYLKIKMKVIVHIKDKSYVINCGDGA